MTNHPNRSQPMLRSLYQWLSSTHAKVLTDIPLAKDGKLGLKNRIVEAYKAGYRDAKNER